MEWDVHRSAILPGQVGGWIASIPIRRVHPHRLSALSDRSVAMGWANSRYRHSRSGGLCRWNRRRTIKQELNGCYVSGTIAGYTAWVKISKHGWGAECRSSRSLIRSFCHVDALRAGITILSVAGPGHNLTAELLVTAGRQEQSLDCCGLGCWRKSQRVRGMVRGVKVRRMGRKARLEGPANGGNRTAGGVRCGKPNAWSQFVACRATAT